jgi:enoyl-CoA hydratase
MDSRLLVDRDDAVTRITLNRPDSGNRVSNAMGAELAELIAEAGRESLLVVLGGAGEDFCLGRDIAPPAPGDRTTAQDVRLNDTEPALRVFEAFRRCPAPIIGVVQGAAHGFGCAVAGLCDITIAADDASFQIPEMSRDLPPALVMSALSDRVPRKAVAYMVYSRAEIDAESALRIGLISDVVPADDLDDEVEALIETLSENSAAALRAVKEYMKSAPEMDRDAAADFASNLLANVLSSR